MLSMLRNVTWAEIVYQFSDKLCRSRHQHLAEQNPHLYNKDIAKIVDAIFGEIEAALARGDRVELRGFGVFSVKTRSARPGHNPRTGASVSVPEKWVPAFRTGREMHHRLNRTPGSDFRAAFHKTGDVAKP